MSPSAITGRLQEVGRQLNRWDAQRWGLLAAGGAVALLWLLTLSDLLFRYERAGRVVACVLLLAALAAAGWWISRQMARRRTVEAVAMRVEKAFPQLDNRLINFVQFSAGGPRDALVEACLGEGIPGWEGVQVEAMKDRRAFRHALIAAGAAGLIFAVSALWAGAGWGNALLRVLNPFSARPPGTLARIVAVTPGHAQVLKGAAAVLTLRVTGKAGQPVSVEVRPADDKARTLRIGKLRGDGEEEFSHRVAAVASDLQYRFLAGDAVSPRYTVRALPPLAFRRLQAVVTPPAYMKLESLTFDALQQPPAIPQGSRLEFVTAANRPLAGAEVACAGATNLFRADADQAWRGGTVATADAPYRITARDAEGFTAAFDLRGGFIPDAPPTLKVIAPEGRPTLVAGAAPRIQWEAADDFGLATVTLELVLDEQDAAKSLALTNWAAPAGQAQLSGQWVAAPGSLPVDNTPLVYRLVATDIRPDAPNRTASRLIRFDRVDAMAAAKAEGAAEALGDRLGRLVELQRKNLARTLQLTADLYQPNAAGWTEAQTAQQTIRDIAGGLLADPTRPLGSQAVAIRALYETDMRDAVSLLARIPPAPQELKPALGKQGVEIETRILNALTRTESAAGRIEQHAQITGLLALLEGLITSQEEVAKATGKCVDAAAPAGAQLVDRQDRLAGDLVEFVKRCRKDVAEYEKNDKAFAALVTQAAASIEQQKISGTLLKAAEHLEAGAAGQALPLQRQAIAQLKAIYAELNKWRLADAEEKTEDLQEALAGAQQKLEKLTQVQSKVVDAIRQTLQQKDHSEKETEEIEQEIGEVKENMQEALLKIATDLHIFPELPVGNDLVADVSQIYEECKQVPGSAEDKATELGLQKEDWILKALETATERIDDMEMWLMSKPDSVKRLTENFDKQEQPTIPVIPMASEMEDIIGDLLEQQEEEKNKSDDSATNQGSADFAAGWGIADGEFVNYSAKGKSGNEAPDHKEQDGRSLVGREGMANGETAAGSGKINEGDKNIEARRTQDSAQSGEVQEEGHATAKATGGGKQSGFSEQLGMAGTGPRRDTKAGEGQGSMAGMQALLRRNAEAVYAKASLLHIRTGSLDEAVRQMTLAEDGMKKGLPIREIREYQRRAIAALKKSQVELDGGTVIESFETRGGGGAVPASQIAGAADEAPAEYRDLVSDYFKSLSEGEK